MESSVEHFVLSPTEYVPNNRLPVLVYRDVLPKPHTEEATIKFLEAHMWEKKGVWTGTPVHHFHPNTHECYAVIQGTTTMCLGRGQLDDPNAGQLVALKPGDVLVLPAGTAHMNVTMTEDYLFVGVYPNGSPHWKSERCDNKGIMTQLHEEVSNVPRPVMDPVFGLNGPLAILWTTGERDD